MQSRRRSGNELAAWAALACATACAGGQTGHNSGMDCGEHVVRDLTFDEAAAEGYDVRPLLSESDGGVGWPDAQLEVKAPAALWATRGLGVPDERIVVATLRTRLRGVVSVMKSDCGEHGGLSTDVELEIVEVDAVLSGFGYISTSDRDGGAVKTIEEFWVDELGGCLVDGGRSRLTCEHE